MGKGNQFIKNRDGDGVRTFYFDPYDDFEETKKAMIQEKREDIAEELAGLPFAKRRRKLEQIMLEGRFPVRIKDESVWDRISNFADDEIDNIGYELGGKTGGIPGFTRREKREFEDCLAAGYRDSGFVIAESDNCQVVIADNESNVAIACIPAESKDNIRDTVEQDTELEGEALDAEVERRYAAHFEKFKADANAAMRKIHEFFGTQSISERDGAWTSIRLKPYAELTEEERNNYY